MRAHAQDNRKIQLSTLSHSFLKEITGYSGVQVTWGEQIPNTTEDRQSSDNYQKACTFDDPG